MSKKIRATPILISIALMIPYGFQLLKVTENPYILGREGGI
jgi:hypothetical protein